MANSSQQVVVDFSSFEADLENIKPLRRGHNPSVLKKICQSKDAGENPARMEQKLAEEKKTLQNKIDEYQGDDPLIPWLNLIQWTQQNYPSGDPKSGVLELLERCVRTFKDDSRYKANIR